MADRRARNKPGMAMAATIGTTKSAPEPPDPINELPTDFEKLKSYGSRGTLLLMSDSTGAENPNHSLSEKTIQNPVLIATIGSLYALKKCQFINELTSLVEHLEYDESMAHPFEKVLQLCSEELVSG